MLWFEFIFQADDDVMKEEEGKKPGGDPNDPKTMLAKAGAAVDDEYDSRKGSDTTYYSIAHALREAINEQPSILGFGQLKAYQVSLFFFFFLSCFGLLFIS